MCLFENRAEARGSEVIRQVVTQALQFPIGFSVETALVFPPRNVLMWEDSRKNKKPVTLWKCEHMKRGSCQTLLVDMIKCFSINICQSDAIKKKKNPLHIYSTFK